MNPFVLAAYGVILGTLAAYALRLWLRRRQVLRGAAAQRPPR